MDISFDDYKCYKCRRPLQQTTIAEVSGLCDYCRSVNVTKPSFRTRMAKLLAEDPEGCECPVCVKNWEDWG